MAKVMKTLIVDDHALLRAGVAGLLRQQADFEVVGEAEDGETAIVKAKELMPDLILMDVYMPGIGGLEAIRRIKDALPYVKIVMLTMSADEKDLFEAIKAGAHGYLLKNTDLQVFFQTLRGVFRGEAPISVTTATKILHEFARLANRNEQDDGTAHNLSGREREVLEHVTLGATNKEIASTLGIAENTVKNHLKNILEKLHLENRVQAATFALRERIVGSPGESVSRRPR